MLDFVAASRDLAVPESARNAPEKETLKAQKRTLRREKPLSRTSVGICASGASWKMRPGGLERCAQTNPLAPPNLPHPNAKPKISSGASCATSAEPP